MRLSTLAIAGVLGAVSAAPVTERGLKVDCVSSDLTGTLAEFSYAWDAFCDDLSSNNQHLTTGEVYTTANKYCTQDRCIVLYLAFTGTNRASGSTTGSLSYGECTSYFSVRPFAYDTVDLYCASGWYGGAIDGGGSWSTEIVVTTPEKYADRPRTSLPAFESNPDAPKAVDFGAR